MTTLSQGRGGGVQQAQGDDDQAREVRLLEAIERVLVSCPRDFF
jgi:hypothetical protein